VHGSKKLRIDAIISHATHESTDFLTVMSVQIQYYTHTFAGSVHATIPLVICSSDPSLLPDGPDGRGNRSERVVNMKEEWALMLLLYCMD
jgi:hypothetical protein